MVDRIRSMPQLDESIPVMVPGDPEKKSKAEREKSGIPMLEVVFDEYLEVSPNFRKAVIN